jgi:hypothetical protein
MGDRALDGPTCAVLRLIGVFSAKGNSIAFHTERPEGTGFAPVHDPRMTERGTGPTEAVRRERWNVTNLCVLLHHTLGDLGIDVACNEFLVP